MHNYTPNPLMTQSIYDPTTHLPPLLTMDGRCLPPCLIGANKLLNTKRDSEKPQPQILCLMPSLLAIKFSHFDQCHRQLVGIVVEAVEPWLRTVLQSHLCQCCREHGISMSSASLSVTSTVTLCFSIEICFLFFFFLIQVIHMQIWCRVLQYIWP